MLYARWCAEFTRGTTVVTDNRVWAAFRRQSLGEWSKEVEENLVLIA